MLDPVLRFGPARGEQPPAERVAEVSDGADTMVGMNPSEQQAAAGQAAAEATPGEDGLDPAIAALLKRDPAGLVAAVVQEQATGEVLMVGWMDDLALHRTLTTGRSTFYSRSRHEYWVKGETSGHRQWVREVRLDCDGDTLLLRVEQDGPACHTGARSCFDERLLPAVVLEPSATTTTEAVRR